MKNRLITSFTILILFVVVFYGNCLGLYFQNGTWVAGVTEVYVWFYIATVISICFLVAFKPNLQLIYALMFAPLASSLVCKSVSVLLLSLHLYINLKNNMIAISGLFMAGILFFYYYQLNGNGRLVLKYALLLFVAVLPISYEFSYQILQHKNYL